MCKRLEKRKVQDIDRIFKDKIGKQPLVFVDNRYYFVKHINYNFAIYL